MLNLVGEAPDSAAILRIPGVHLHLYGKAPRPGRKIGHVTLQAADADDLQGRLARVDAVTARGASGYGFTVSSGTKRNTSLLMQ